MDSATRQRQIAKLAYQIYEKEGRPQGRELEHWLKAQKRWEEKEFLEEELLTEEAEGGLVPKA